LLKVASRHQQSNKKSNIFKRNCYFCNECTHVFNASLVIAMSGIGFFDLELTTTKHAYPSRTSGVASCVCLNSFCLVFVYL
jgi:hypothetical protein